MDNIIIENVTINNLKNFSITIPKGKFISLTGISGSGKSSLAFDLLFLEAKKTYFQSIGIIPDLDVNDLSGKIKGISPVIAVKQNIIRDRHPKSLVSTKSGLLHLLRELYVAIGNVNCPVCGEGCVVGLNCTKCNKYIYPIRPDIINFNSYNGMCLDCKGYGYSEEPDIYKLIPDMDISLRNLCKKVYNWSKSDGPQNFYRKYNIDPEISYNVLSNELKEIFLYGFYDKEYGRYTGLIQHVKRKSNLGNDSNAKTEYKKKYFKTVACKYCNGLRISEEAMSITILDKNIGELNEYSIVELKKYLELLEKEPEDKYSYGKKRIKNEVIHRLQELLDSFIDVGLDYLTLNREMRTLSGGEIQRFLLMSHLSAETDGFIYIFDEPTTGLHEAEKRNLLDKIKKLYHQGNTIIIIEHDRYVIKESNYFIDIGPYAGKNGGKLVYQGDYEGLLKCKDSITGQYLANIKKLPVKNISDYKNIDETTQKIQMRQVSTNNLKKVDVDIPLGAITGFAGVSGSGKSSLVSSTLVPILHKMFKDKANNPIDDIDNDEISLELSRIKIQNINGLEHLQGYARITQMPIGRNIRSIPVTYVGIWDNIRKLFASQELAKSKKINAEHFSFNSKGACDACQGTGVNEKTLGMVGEICTPCFKCEGKRYQKEILEVKYKGKSISDILDMDISEATEFFYDKKSIFNKLSLLHETGLGYIKMGQPTTTLSGGEAQRLKIANDLNSERKGHIIYILDEPTSGLSYFDIENLLILINKIAERGNSILIIEHDPYLLSICDWIIELGPGSGDKGGTIISQGTPFDIINNKNSIIGKYLFKN